MSKDYPSVHDILRERLLERVYAIAEASEQAMKHAEQSGYPEVECKDIPTILEKQMSWDFLNLMANRMVIGYFRYGDLRKRKTEYDAIGSAIERLKEYQKSGNQEHLPDVANLCMVEFIRPQHKHVHFESIDDGIHAKEA